MNKRLSLLLAAALLMSGHAMAGDIKQIRFGIEAGYPPFDIKNPDGSLSGFDYDLGNAICAELKAKCVWVENAFDGMIPALKAKKFDGILSSMSITDKRRQEIAFSDAMYPQRSRLVARAAEHLQPTLASLKGKRIGVQQGTTEEMYAQTYWKPAGVEVVSYESQDLAYADLRAGRLNATLQDRVEAYESFLSKPENKEFAYAGPSLKEDKMFGYGAGIGMRKEDQQLRQAINGALAKIKANGTYTRLMRKYFHLDLWAD